MRLSLKYETPNRADFFRSFNNLERSLDDFSPVFKAMLSPFRVIIKSHLESGGNGGGGKFASLTPKYKADKERKYGNKSILTASGRMYRSLTQDTADSVVIIDKKEAAFGTSVPYAKYHQTGTRRLPERKPIDLSAAQFERLAREARKSIVPLLEKSGMKVS